MTSTRTQLLSHLTEAGYKSYIGSVTSDRGHCQRFDLGIPGVGTLRVSVYRSDGDSVQVDALDTHDAGEWGVSFSPNTPDQVIVSALIGAGSRRYRTAEWAQARARWDSAFSATLGRNVTIPQNDDNR
jgi:hypothetical protein